MTHTDASHFARNDTKALSTSLNKPASFKLKYFPINAAAATSREILAFGGADWENLAPKNWNEEKHLTPFLVMPVLYIKTQDGKDLALSEAIIVDHYLAKHFGLLGDNEYEENLIKIFHCSSIYIQSNFAQGVTWSSPQSKEGNTQYFVANTLPTWIATHEKHLRDNGNNGHYMGDKLSLADIRTSNAIEHFAIQPEAKDIMPLINKSVELTKLRETVAQDPKIAKWRAGETYQKLLGGSKAFFANPFAFIAQ
ncbi:hypothetical protein EDD11_006833 [Mortierella claussenii]|nr:hypothetical protein EDD11_006833 [Mortierella claussenii]